MSEKEGYATVRAGIEVNKLIAIVFKKIERLFKNFGGGAVNIYSPEFDCFI